MQCLNSHGEDSGNLSLCGREDLLCIVRGARDSEIQITGQPLIPISNSTSFYLEFLFVLFRILHGANSDSSCEQFYSPQALSGFVGWANSNSLKRFRLGLSSIVGWSLGRTLLRESRIRSRRNSNPSWSEVEFEVARNVQLYS